MKSITYISLITLFSFVLMACGVAKKPSIEVIPYGVTSGGDSVTLYRLTNSSGFSMEIIDYGCRVVRIIVPDKNGKADDVVLGYDDIKGYETGGERFFGALLGRYANRISKGRFTLDSVEYQLSCNNAPNGFPCHLHGGDMGFDRVMWKGEPFELHDTIGVRFTRLSSDGEEGYPGNLSCEVKYFWTPENTWRIEYRATTDKPTIVNMSQHSYFNLKGGAGGTVLDNYLTVYADSMTPNNAGYVPIGEIVPVAGTPLDFRKPHTFLERIDQPNEHMRIMEGYSANWVLNNQTGRLAKAAILSEPVSGRRLEVWTTEPGILIYTGRLLSEKIIGKQGRPLSKYGGLILETIHYPDTPNHSDFPSCVLRPGEEYFSATEYRFLIDSQY
ncbi:MAG: aldose epimerase family protein [Paludibacter sp.]|nr:aldose epimerase family protein [Paludibacter sp.]